VWNQGRVYNRKRANGKRDILKSEIDAKRKGKRLKNDGVGRATTTEQSLERVQCETKSEYIIERVQRVRKIDKPAKYRSSVIYWSSNCSSVYSFLFLVEFDWLVYFGTCVLTVVWVLSLCYLQWCRRMGNQQSPYWAAVDRASWFQWWIRCLHHIQ